MSGAILDYDQAIELEPEDGDFYYARGVAHASLKHYNEAIRDFQEALKWNSADVQRLLQPGDCLP